MLLKLNRTLQSSVLETASRIASNCRAVWILALAVPQVQHLQQEGSQRPADALVDGERPARDRTAVRLPSVVDEAAQGA